MKTEMIALSWSGLMALLTATITITLTFITHEWIFALVAVSLLAYVREDARTAFANGAWTRGWIFWSFSPEQT